MARINLRIDEELKENATILFKDLGMDMTTAITIFLTQSVNMQGLPFLPSKEPIEKFVARHELEQDLGKTYNSVSDFMSSLENED